MEPEVLERVAGIVEEATHAVVKNPVLPGSLVVALVLPKARFGEDGERE